MLIYNFHKEFLGIDAHDLKALGFSNLAELRAESEDFANLFVRTPGYIHNFKHVHWIDYLSCAEESEDSKVIIHTKGKNYKCTLIVKTAYLVDNPSNKAYLITLQNLRALTSDESASISHDIDEREIPLAAQSESRNLNIPKTTVEEKVIQNSEEKTLEKIEEEIVENVIEKAEILVETPQAYDIEEINKNQEAIAQEVHDDSPIEIDLDADDETAPIPQVTEVETIKKRSDEESLEIPIEVSSYTYDPHIASEELGLTLDLIEEFLEDFITQANDFKENLFTALDNGNITEVKALSHKLKGVAANLRIENARDALIIINTSEDIDEIKHNLNLLYLIITKLTNQKRVQQNANANAKEFLTPSNDTQNDSIYNKESVAKEIGLDINNFNELFKDFINEAQKTISVIADAVLNNQYQVWQQNATKLQSISNNMRVTLYTKELEELLNTQDSTVAEKNLNAINQVISEIGK